VQKPIILLNFTHAYEGMDFLRAMPCQWVDCTHLRGTQCYCDSEGERRLRALLAPYPPEGIHLIDSGDYHYVTKLWTDKIDHPFSLIVFDHHPDMQPPLFEGLLSCGCWVRTVLDTNPHVQKVCIVGATEKLKQETAGYDGRLVYFSEQTLRLREAWHVFSRLWLNEPVYISIDKDVLTPRQATTNWDQGSLSLGQLESFLRVILRHERVIGIDICGELPLCQPSSPSRQTANEQTDKELLEWLHSHLSGRKDG